MLKTGPHFSIKPGTNASTASIKSMFASGTKTSGSGFQDRFSAFASGGKAMPLSSFSI